MPVDPRTEPIFRQIARAYERQITAGILAPGSPIPSERELALEHSVSRMTARRAIDALALRGLVERRERIGVTVARPKIAWDLSSVVGLHEQLSRQGIAPGAEVLRAEMKLGSELDTEIGAHLHLSPDEAVYVVFRRRTGDGEPIALEHSYFPASRFPGLLEHDLTGSIYRLLSHVYGTPPARSEQKIEPTVLGSRAASDLSASPEVPVLKITGTAWDKSNNPIQYARDVYRGDRISFLYRGEVESLSAD